MGCDIHVKFEVRKRQHDGSYKWFDCTPLCLNPMHGVFADEEKYEDLCWFGRDYRAFSLLAGVRNYNEIEPISAPKGVPDDVSESVKQAVEKEFDYSHNHSYFTLQDIEYYCLKHPEVIFENGNITAGELLKEYIDALKFVHRYSGFGDETTLRMIFWFDN